MHITDCDVCLTLFLHGYHSMEATFTGKRAIVTGAGKGIGRATAVKLAEVGAHVVAISRTQADLESLKEQVPCMETCLLDVADWDRTRAAVDQLGPVDLLVNNAAVTSWTNFLEATKEEVYNVHAINYKATFNISQVVARGMVKRGVGGAIVNMSSISAKRASRDHSVYCTAKAAVDMLTSTMAVDLGPHKIRVNSVNPGLVLTAMGSIGHWSNPENQNAVRKRTPLGRLTEVKDVVDAIVYLLSDKAAMVTGTSLMVDDGMMNVF